LIDTLLDERYGNHFILSAFFDWAILVCLEMSYFWISFSLYGFYLEFWLMYSYFVTYKRLNHFTMIIPLAKTTHVVVIQGCKWTCFLIKNSLPVIYAYLNSINSTFQKVTVEQLAKDLTHARCTMPYCFLMIVVYCLPLQMLEHLLFYMF
jgi:hypothetical protein